MTAKDPLKGDPNQLQKGAAKLESQNYFIQGRTGKYEIVPVLILTLVMMAQRHNVIRLCHALVMSFGSSQSHCCAALG